MSDVFSEIDAKLRTWIEAQHMFFVATAPLGGDGRVNLSPKGTDSLRVLDGQTIAYLDYVGSGVETIAHLRENGRITVMMCAFAGPPRIVRLQGRGEAVGPGHAGLDALRAQFPEAPGVRAVIRIRVERASDSCGYAVPLYSYEGERTALGAWAEKKGPEGLVAYQRDKNAASIDGLPGLRWVGEESE